MLRGVRHPISLAHSAPSLVPAGMDDQLVMFEALPHAFWYDYHSPETKEALDLMTNFVDRHLGRR